MTMNTFNAFCDNLNISVSVPAAHLTSNWNFPQISWLASSTEFADKDRFTTFVRTMGPYSKIGIAFVAIFERFGWKRVGLLHVHDGKISHSIFVYFGP